METFVGDTVTLDVETGIDLSGYSSLFIKFRRPDRTVGHWHATINPADITRMVYDTLPTDLNMPGTWVLQAHAEDAGIRLHGRWVDLIVFLPIPETTSPPTTLPPTTVAPTTAAP